MFHAIGIVTIFGNHFAIFRQVLDRFQREVWGDKKMIDCLMRQICINSNYETTFNLILRCDSAIPL